MKKKKEYNISIKNKCKLLGWRTDLMSTYIMAKNSTGHEKEGQALTYHLNNLRKTHTPVEIV